MIKPLMVSRYGGHVASLAVILVLYGFTRLPDVSDTERAALASRFAFTKLAMPELPNQTYRAVRAVHPSMEHISAWISSVGASVALNDLDGDGLSNDVCYVEVRTDQVIVAPAPGTPPRYAPFALDPAPLFYDAATTAPMGCLPGDLNEDGWTDLLVYYWGRPPIAFLRDGVVPSPVPTAYVRRDVAPNPVDRWFTNAATRADFDGDGHADLVFGNYFDDGARILDAEATDPQHMQHSMSRAFNGGHNRLFLWRSAESELSVHFEEAEGVFEETVARGWTLALGAADLDGDLLPELYFANDFGPDRLLHNRSTPGHPRFALLEGHKTFTTPSSKIVGQDSFKGMGIDFGDLNGDGWLDLYVSNIAAEYALEESHFMYVSTGAVERMREGVAPYRDRSEPLGLSRSDWGWEARLADFDNDGVLEAVQATGFIRGTANRWPELQELATGNDELLADLWFWPRFQPGDDLSGRVSNPFFVRSRSGRYVDLAPELGLDGPYITRGIATADVDGDGDLDLALGNQWEPSLFFRNDRSGDEAFLGLHVLRATEPEEATRVSKGHQGHDAIGTISEEKIHPSKGARGMSVAGSKHEHPPVSPFEGGDDTLDTNSIGKISGYAAVGATATVMLPDGRRLTAQVDGGNGHSGARSPDLHFGLGTLPEAASVRVELRWRDAEGHVQHDLLTLTPGWHTIVLAGTESGDL